MIDARPEITKTPRHPHGGPAGLADEAAPVRIDFSVSLNAWGPAEAIRDAVRAASMDAYPDPEALAPRRAAAARWNRPVEEIAFGAGAAELIFAACFAFLRPGDIALIPGPTFGEYARAAALCGARILHGIASAPAFRLDTASIAGAVAEHRPRLVFLCTPNNPTGERVGRVRIGEVAEACRIAGTLLVLDQSYDAFLEDPLGVPALPGHPAVLALRSITKEHALAGVRAAFAVGPAEVIRALERARVPWSASSAAQAAGVAALTDDAAEHVTSVIPLLRAERARLEEALTRLGIRTVPTATHFLLAGVGDASRIARLLRMEHGVAVRDCTSFGLPDHIRVAARTAGENDVLVAALEAVCSA